jgi:hypothetical protein
LIVGGSPCIDVPEEDWREIEETLGLEQPNNEVRKSIAFHVRKHLFSAEEFNFHRQRPGSQQKWITRIRNKTQRLIDVLDWDASADESEDAHAQMYAVYDLLERKEQKNLLAMLKGLLASADNMLGQIPKGKSGPDPDAFSWGLVFDLACLYQWATNERPKITYNADGPPDIEYGPEGKVGMYESQFLNFVAAVFAVFAPDRAKGNIPLGKHVARVLNMWRRYTHQKDKTPD